MAAADACFHLGKIAHIKTLSFFTLYLVNHAAVLVPHYDFSFNAGCDNNAFEPFGWIHISEELVEGNTQLNVNLAAPQRGKLEIVSAHTPKLSPNARMIFILRYAKRNTKQSPSSE